MMNRITQDWAKHKAEGRCRRFIRETEDGLERLLSSDSPEWAERHLQRQQQPQTQRLPGREAGTTATHAIGQFIRAVSSRGTSPQPAFRGANRSE